MSHFETVLLPQRVTDGRTDEFAIASTALCIAAMLTRRCWRAVTRSSATAEKQRVSCARLPRLVNWSYTMHTTPQNRRGCMIQEVLAKNGFWHKTARQLRYAFFFFFFFCITNIMDRVVWNKRVDWLNSHSRSSKVMHFALSYRPTRGSISSYNIACRISEVFEDVAT